MTSPATNDLSQAAQAFRAAVLRRERDASTQMAVQYARAWRAIRGDLNALLSKMDAAVLAGDEVRPGWLYQQGRLSDLLHQVERQIVSFAGTADTTITAAQKDVVDLAQLSVKALVDQQLGPGIVQLRWARLPADALESVVGTLSDGSPLASLLDELGPDAVAGVRDALFNGIALGLSSARIAEQVQLALGGNLVRALSISRTETLRSYREVSQASYRANSDVVAKWRWEAGRSLNCCAACWAMDGTLHDLDEPLDDHVRGACVPVPITFTYAELGFPDIEEHRTEYTSGVERFRALSEPEQLAILGPAKFAAYHDGRIELTDLVRQTQSKRWGPMRSEDSLKNALAKAARR